MKKNNLSLVLGSILLFSGVLISNSQSPDQYIFATLQGSPVIDTAGWNFQGYCTLGDTPGDTNSDADEVIICPIGSFLSGAIFYKQPINLGTCNSWVAEFEYRIYDGNGADGIAFCFLKNPPSGFNPGGGIGIPSTPEGLLIVLDQHNNCGGGNPELQIRYGDGVNNYSECTTSQPTLNNVSIIRQRNYNRMRVVYNQGAVEVYINDDLYLEGYFYIDYAGYMGFTSGTGAANDLHSIRNFVMYTDSPLASIHLSESPLELPPVLINEISTDTLQITNYGCDTLLINDITLTGDDFSIPAVNLPQALSGNDRLDIPVSFMAYRVGENLGELNIFSEVGNTTVELIGTGCIGVPEITTQSGETNCPESYRLSSNIEDNIRWSTGETAPSITVRESGMYILEYTGPYACDVYTDTVFIEIIPRPVITASPDTMTCLGKPVTLTVQNAVNYLWSTGDTTQSITVSPESNTGYTVECYNERSCYYVLSIVITNSEPPEPVTNMLPADQSINLSLPVILSWLPSQNTILYDLYVWSDTSSRPLYPSVYGITQISYRYSYLLNYGEKYNWQIVSRNAQCSTEGPIQSFTIRELPDLEVTVVNTPLFAYSGESIQIDWEIFNGGEGATVGQWTDFIYLSTDTTLESVDTYLGSIANQSALQPGQSYANSARFKLPNGINGDYYIIVYTNRYLSIIERDYYNNSLFNTDALPVTLTSPADLQVDSILMGTQLVYSGQPFEISWTVKNKGQGKTDSDHWSDKVYISADTLFKGTEKVLTETVHTGVMEAGEGYKQTVSVNMPYNVSGIHYIYVYTDFKNQIYEHANENNNFLRSDSLEVILTPPPDLIVTEISIPDTASNNQSISVQWQVNNQSGSITLKNTWFDSIYFASTDVFDPGSVINKKTLRHNGFLDVGETYESKIAFVIPSGINGPFYFFVKTDATDAIFEFEENNENNTTRSEVIVIETPDLIVSDISLGDTGYSGEEIMIEWSVNNIGVGSTYGANWKDYIMISKEPVYDSASCTRIDEADYYKLMSEDDTIHKQQTIVLPDGLQGMYYIYVFTDCRDNLFETNENNNMNTNGIPVFINLSPWPDLQILSVNAPDTITAGNLVNIDYAVRNFGTAATKNIVWTDTIYLSSDPIWNASSVTSLRGFLAPKALEKDSSYSLSEAVLIPYNIPEGNYYLYAYTDAIDTIYEYTAENNNTGRSDLIHIHAYPPVDLAVKDVFGPDSAASGKPVNIQWTVKNIGTSATQSNSWIDAAYLSIDTLWSAEDILVDKWLHKDNLQAGTSYTSLKTVALPNGISGNYYLLVVCDTADINNDFNRSNNVKAITNKEGQTVPVIIDLTPSADLTITSFLTPENAISGQPLKAVWTISNNGTGSTVHGTWIEQFYLSTDMIIDYKDRVVGLYSHTGVISSRASYTDSIQLMIPINAIGNYILIMKTDNNNVEYEHLAEDNNTAISYIVCDVPPPADLTVSDITIPSQSLAGEMIDVSWRVNNTGDYPASGIMKDMIYISADTIWDVNDIILGSVSSVIDLLPMASIERSLSNELPGASIGDYYIIVRTDILNNIYELNDTNNTSVSEDLLNITVKDLHLNTRTGDVLTNNKPLYYKIEIPDSLEGEALYLELKGDSINGHNEVYIRYFDIPTQVDYDYSHENPYFGNQEVIVPVLEEGTYYLMVFGNTTAAESQSVELYATKLNFEIRSITANKGGNTGKVTVLIQGAKFDPSIEISMQNADNTIVTDTIRYVNSTKVYATFNLDEQPIGIYDVIGSKSNGETTLLPEGFEVIKGTVSDLQVTMRNPDRVVRGSTVALVVEYSNAGTNDLDSVMLVMNSVSNSPISFTAGGLKNKTRVLQLLCTELNGPDQILRPEARGTIVVYSKDFGGLGFTVTK